MRDRFQPGHLLVLPSGRRARILRVWGADVLCRYEVNRPEDRRHGVSVNDGDMALAKLFCERHCLLVEVAS